METDTGSLADRIRQLEEKIENGIPAVNIPGAGTEGKYEGSAAPPKQKMQIEFPKAIPEDVKQAVGSWAAIVGETPMPMKAYLKNAYPSLAKDGSLLVIVQDGMPADYFREASHREEFENILSGFMLDPQQLITKTEAAAYEGSRFEEGATLFFRHSDKSAEETYSSSSDALTIINKGSAPVEVELTASVVPDSLGGIVMTDDRDFIDDTDPSLYLALTDGDQTVAIDEEYGASICVTVDGVSDGDEKGSSYSFRLTGAVNGNGDWSELTDAAPKVIVTWMVTADEEMEREDDSSLRSHGRDNPFCRE